ncbi:hypothetical protein [Alkalicoccus daliensis]|uniref:Uncharacterized protein n=1 Tax=Alkalicoccus daliensis TaxID=745820 RepID=A0A1G9ZKT9_9BACI|nr:hypothetical protein [Alkalicoccus daliensis]SDN21256.1 hypothetical protein SAMN04488053_101124 [Alkalicoccus daliensis]
MESNTHQHLKHQALLWLKAKMTDLCATEVKFVVQRRKRTADAVGINMKRKEARIVEVKASRSDFLRDEVLQGELGYDAVAAYAYILTPAGLLKKEEVPERYGLLEIDEYDNIKVIKRPVKNKKPKLKLETLIKRTGRAATNAFLFQQESKLSRDKTNGAFEKKALAHLVRITCAQCKKRNSYVIAPDAEEITCAVKTCGHKIEVHKGRPFHVTSYNEDFLKQLSQVAEQKNIYVVEDPVSKEKNVSDQRTS